MLLYLEILATCLSLSGMFLVVHKYRIGWLIWIFASLFWLYIFNEKDIQLRMVVEIVYTFQAGYGYYKWRKKDVIR